MHGAEGSSGAHCHDHEAAFDGSSRRYRRILWAVAGLNGAMFLLETVAGHAAGSKALQADALDFLGDALTYALSLWAIGKPLAWRARTAVVKGVSLLVMAAWVLGSTLVEALFPGGPPGVVTMGLVGGLALAVNLGSVLLLLAYRDGDANVRSVWLCSRNDAIGNVVVLLAALGVWGSASAWPDLIVAGLMAGLFLSSALHILARARRELDSIRRDPTPHPAARPH